MLRCRRHSRRGASRGRCTTQARERTGLGHVAQGPHARSERYASGGLAVVIGLDDGPALRVPAAEPLAGRDSGSPSRLGEGEDTPG